MVQGESSQEEHASSGPVGIPDGVAPLDHLRDVLGRLTPIWGERRPLILTHKSPDPDALGAMVGVDFLLRGAFGLDPVTATMGRIFRAENRAMVRELSLWFEDYEAIDPTGYGGVFLVDTQPGFGHTVVPGVIPMVAVFDHHKPLPIGADGQTDVPPHVDIRQGVGATAAMVYGYIRDAGLEMDTRTATAICCGVRFDTADLSAHSTELDAEAFYESFRRADRAMLARINRPVLPPSYYRELHRSLSRARRHGSIVFGLLGRVQNPETVAEMADFFLRMEGSLCTLVGGAFEGNYHISVRTEGPHREAYPILAGVLDGEGTFGGRGPVAGGQVPLKTPDELTRLERRLRERILKLVDPADLDPADPKQGTKLTRLL